MWQRRHFLIPTLRICALLLTHFLRTTSVSNDDDDDGFIATATRHTISSPFRRSKRAQKMTPFSPLPRCSKIAEICLFDKCVTTTVIAVNVGMRNI